MKRYISLSMKSFKDKILSLYNRDDIQLRHKLIIVLVIGIMIGDTVGTIFDFINGLYDTRINIIMFVVCVFSLIIIAKFKKYDLAVNFTVASIGFVILPFMFFEEGGIHSGMILWLFFSVVVAFLMMDGAAKYIVCALIILVDIGCLLVEYNYPEIGTKLKSEANFMSDMISSFICTSVILCALILIHIRSYDNQRKKLLQQKQELIEGQKKLEEALLKAQDADHAKSDFLANMSHEIRTPINAILGMDEMILREADAEEIREYAANIQASGRTLLSIINDILDFSKVESGRMDLFPEKYQISSMANDVCNMIAPRIQEKDLKLHLKNNPELPSVLLGDEARIRQALLNLMTNAVKYTHTGSVTVDFDYDKTGDDTILLKISVTDTGIGIKKENLDYLFQTFRRIDLKANRRIEGTGLGLAITKNIIELMGGTISVDSNYGVGSTFTISVPQTVVDWKRMGDVVQQNKDVGSEYKVSFRAPKAQILAVDDVAINLKVLAGLLKQTGIQIDQALSGSQCLEMVQNKHYDIIFMDHMMPELDGVETFKIMKGYGDDYINKDTPVIVLTANAIQGVKEMYLGIGFSAYLSKPVKYEVLEETIRQFLPEELIEV